jgi:hypothetical protein
MRIAALAKKFVSPIAVLVSALLALTGVVPANAAAPAAASNLSSTQVNSNWVIGSGNAATLANTQGLNWNASFESRTTAWQGKTLSLAGGVLPAIANSAAYVSAQVNYYKSDGTTSSTYSYANLNAGTSGGSDTNPIVPLDAARITISIRAGFNSQIQNGDVNPVAGTTYTPTFTIKLDGVAQTTVNTWTGSNTFASDDIHLTGQPTFTQYNTSGSFEGSSSYATAYQTVYSCVDLTTLNTGDALQIHPFVEGVDKYNDSSYVPYPRVRTLENYSSPVVNAVSTTTVTAGQKTIGGQLIFESDYNRYGSRLKASGANSYALSIQNTAGQELNVPCAISPISSSIVPTLTVSGSYLAVSVTDPSFSTTSYMWYLYKASDNTLLGSGTGYGTGTRSLQNCGMNGCTSLAPVGVSVYVKVAKSQQITYNGFAPLTVTSGLSTQSANAALPDPWISVSPAVSGGNAPGDASVISSNIDYAAATQDPAMMLPSLPTASDGNNGVFKTAMSVDITQMQPVVSVKLFRLGATGIDSTFAGAGAGGVTLSTGSSTNTTTVVGWYGARNKWTALMRTMGFGPTPSMDFKIVQGTYSGATLSTPIVKTKTQLDAYCDSLTTGSVISNMTPVSAPTSDQLFSVSCSKNVMVNGMGVMGYTFSYVKIAADGTITKLKQLNTGDVTTDTGFSTLASVQNVSASAASDVALTLVGYSVKFVSQTQTDIVARKGYQVSVDGTFTEVANPYTSAATTSQTEKVYVFSRTSLGAATTGFLRTVTAGVISYKWATLGANGVITEGDAVTLDAVPSFNVTTNGNTVDASILGFVDGQEVGVGGKIQMRRSLGLSKVASVTVDLDAKTFDTGEVVSYVNSMDSRVLQMFFVDDQGRLNWMYTSANNVLSLIRWNGVNGSGGALPTGVTVTNISTAFITNAAAVVTITGTGLNLITGKLTIGGILVTPTSKTATKLVFTIPAGTVAGPIDIVAPFAAGAATLGSVNRVGATKQAQTITDTPDVSETWTGASTKVTATFPATTSVGLATSLKVDKSAVCSVSGQVVTMNASGTCVVTVSSAGDLGTAAAVNQTTSIVVAPRTQNVTSLLTALAAAATTWAGTSQTVALPGVLTSVGLATTITVAPAAVCTYAAGVVTLKAAGTCAVTITGVADPGTPAIAKTVQNVVVAKGDLALTVDASLSVSNNPADISGDNLNIRSVNAEVAGAAASLVDFTFASSNEDICTVDEDGNVTGVAIGTCVITTSAVADANWAADTATTSVTVANTDTVVDILPEVGDGNLAPKAIVNNKTAFVATNDTSLLVKWDKAAGLLTLQSKGVYTGYIKAEVTFTKDGVSYTCTNVFGTTAPMAGKTAAQKKAALKSKVFTAAAAACKDASGLNVPDSISAPADFAKIKKVAKDTKAANTVAGSAKYEALALTKLKGFAGSMTIKVTRYRAWPTTMKNKAGSTGTGKGIPATVRSTVIALQ